jgi:hypothetical protein
MHRRETRLEKEVEVCATNLAIKTKCMSINVKNGVEWGECEDM